MWDSDRRQGRGKMKFLNGGRYQGNFTKDEADDNGQYEDQYNNLFQVERGNKGDGSDAGCIYNRRLQNSCSIHFTNGDFFQGIFKDGKPNGPGEIFYKQSVKSTVTGLEYEQAEYIGNFRNGMREGYGKMIWADGACFEGTWKNDMRLEGTMIMGQSGWVYRGKFKRDQFHDKDGLLMMPSMTIYQGKFHYNKTAAIGLLLYPNGSIYYGQHQQF